MSLAWTFTGGLLLSVLRLGVPYVTAALGGTMCERAGVINIALEGFLLISALGTALGAAHGALFAATCGLFAGLFLALFYALLVVVFRGDQVVCGVAIFLLADGLSRVLLKAVYGSTSNSPRLAALSGYGPGLFVLATLLLVLLCHASLYHNVFGLRLRAVGERPQAARALGLSVPGVRIYAVALSGLLSAVGGVYLVFEQRQFVALMSGGRGFLALAAMIFGGWRPLYAAAAALLFAGAEALGIRLQSSGLHIPNFLVQLLPYALTLLALLLRGTLTRRQHRQGNLTFSAPAALGQH